MTREEAMQRLTDLQDGSGHTYEAIRMAIVALHREEAEEKGYCHRINYIPKPCENANCDCVEVVRCKDCKKRGAFGEKGFCELYARGVPDEHYCSYGERIEP